MKNLLSRYSLHICFGFAGFYISAVALAYAESESRNFLSVLNSIGVFLASAGAVAALLTLFHVVYSRLEDKEEQEVNYFKYSLFILDRQAMFISKYEDRISWLQDADEVERALYLESLKFDDTLCNAINLERSLGLLSSPNVALLSELDRCQRDFKTLSHTVERRNKLYINDYQRRVQHHLIPGKTFSLDELEKIVGNALLPSLVEFTNEIYLQLPKVREHIIDVHRQLHIEFKRKYPYRKFVESK
ncbi:hypothetical protein [Vibrio parahaemolyticus]|uniref:hypothetical protein n=1 Tax=Vibrio parahaemolyticus TaxID=670 RepID=UPI00084A4096|nr:hypothetical protein [Vibrio parahaemolyticus]EHU5194287.1 hypothetical protein [Vibrio parahaemolyticus]ODY55769.1 hypothetical protein BBM26_13915 [Vibrio parahaemolyticus]ODY61657.1 hypothetical protein BBM96_02015 [Vibrio parahaemolyticus]ODY66293.1 hypothetical protein BBM97_05420 [Vibrio parahaemolyticus]